MTLLVATIAAVRSAAADTPAVRDWTSGRHTLPVAGVERTFLLDLPETVRPGAALLLVFHGYTDSAEGIRRAAGFTPLVAEHGFVAVYPQGSVDRRGQTFFNVGYAFHADEAADDIGFVRELVARLVADLNLDPRAVFSTGMSNGGDISYLLGTQRAPVVRAIAPVAGTMMTSWGQGFAPAGPLPVLAVHGRRDEITRWNGDPEDRDGWGPYLSVDDVIGRWVKGLGAVEKTVTVRPDHAPPRDSPVVLHSWAENATEARAAEVRLYELPEGGHDWPAHLGDASRSTATEIWRFFSRFR
jgi:polyhydroxybutyrate depolymerase